MDRLYFSPLEGSAENNTLVLMSDNRCTICIGEHKANVQPVTCIDGTEKEYRYSFTLSLTSALDGVSGQRRTPATLHPGIDIFINCNWVVTRWQYTFTHKQYTEQHK
jgi:hypothetical protein